MDEKENPLRATRGELIIYFVIRGGGSTFCTTPGGGVTHLWAKSLPTLLEFPRGHFITRNHQIALVLYGGGGGRE